MIETYKHFISILLNKTFDKLIINSFIRSFIQQKLIKIKCKFCIEK
jgi:hypothetical protein